MDILEQSVARGAQLLDRRHPGWRKKIDPRKLKFPSTERCVLGLLYGSFAEGLEELRVRPHEYGFVAISGWREGRNAIIADYEQLTELWKAQVPSRPRQRFLEQLFPA